MRNPLTRRQLKIIQDAHLKERDIMALLREIKRLREVILALRGLHLRMGRSGAEELDDLLEKAHEIIDQEPCPCIAELEYDDRMNALIAPDVMSLTQQAGYYSNCPQH